jgi:CRISPR/Cas system-associated exonuclease Cas4 (RecB family)
MYLSISISAVTCYRRQDVYDAEVAYRQGEFATQVVVGRSLSHEQATKLSEEKAKELAQAMSRSADQWLAQFPRAKE